MLGQTRSFLLSSKETPPTKEVFRFLEPEALADYHNT